MEQIIRSNNIHGYFDGLSDYLTVNETEQGREQQIVLPPLLGMGSISRLKIRQGIEVVITDMTLEEDWNQYIHEDRVFEINYCFSGSVDCYFKGNRSSTQGQSGNMYAIEDSEIHLFKRSKQRYQFLEIRLLPEQVLRYFEYADDHRKVEKWLKSQSGQISPLNNFVTLKRAAYEMVHSTYMGALKRLHMESKIMEIVLLVLEKYMGEQRSTAAYFIKKTDVERLYAAKQIIQDRLENPLTLKQLARATELNELKLKKGFKELFGMTVFEYIRDLRLEKGLFLMQYEQLNIGEAAAAVGYSNPSNFSAAFYKKYGCKPGHYMRSNPV
ncbi:AraC family transcriptional regulator [Paenibacillus contaminans]|uniref:AraC family transcriptional regulator n=1 Tax=Paenibacillus contaminans TaxID=450362 RepID=A0A329MPI5_9BACL|nr:AraC family transcriptional regulator [Paenibacillus contaminans]RAV21664.1 AraC family transcriptional regulator [Paenibacillus contaminans]